MVIVQVLPVVITTKNIRGIFCTLVVIPELDINSELNLPIHIPIVINDELALNVLSDSDSSDDETAGGLFDFLNDDNSRMIYLIVQWAVTALSVLLNNFKTHKCFNKFPVDARTIFKTNLSKNKQMEIQLVPPGIY